MTLDEVIETIEFWANKYSGEYATSKQEEAEIEAEVAAVTEWIKQHCQASRPAAE